MIGTPTTSSNLMYRSFKPTLKRSGLPQKVSTISDIPVLLFAS